MQPGTSIIYATTEGNSETYKDLAKNIYMNDYVSITERSIENVAEGVYGKLKDIPRQIMELHCGINQLEYEDYVTPNQVTLYELPYFFLQSARDIRVQVTPHNLNH